MVSRTKLYSQLDVLESELEQRLIPHLEHAANGKNNLVFCAEDYHSFPELKGNADKETEALIDLGSRILSLKSKLGESSKSSIAERICWYCYEWAEQANDSRNSAQRLAIQFLDEIQHDDHR